MTPADLVARWREAGSKLLDQPTDETHREWLEARRDLASLIKTCGPIDTGRSTIHLNRHGQVREDRTVETFGRGSLLRWMK